MEGDGKRRFSLNLPGIEPPPNKSMSPRVRQDSEKVYQPKSPDAAKNYSPRCGSLSARVVRKQAKKTSDVQNDINEMISSLKSHDYSKLKLKKTSFEDELSALTGTQSGSDPDTEPPKIYFSEASQALQLSQMLLRAVQDIEDEQPEYFESATISDTQVCRRELAGWFYVMSEGIRQVSSYSKSLALLLDRVKARLVELYRRALDQVDELQALIVEQDPVALDAVECENTEDAPFRADLVKLEVAVQNSKIGDADKASLVEAVKRIEQVVNKKGSDESEIGRLKREVETLKQRNKELSLANFNIQSKKHIDDQKISDLMDVTKLLRKTISENEQKIDTLSQSNAAQSQLSQNMAAVPDVVLNTWTQAAAFCRQVLDGALMDVDFAALFPKDPTQEYSPHYLSLQKPETRDDEVHFMSFFTEIKKAFDTQDVFTNLQTRLRQFLATVSKLYVDNFTEFKKQHEDIAAQSVRKLDEMRSATADGSALLGTFATQKEYLQMPKKAKPVDIEVSLKTVYRYASSNDRQRSTSQAVANAFGGFKNGEIVPFIVQVAKQSQDNAEVDLFRRFLICDIPYDQFLFYSQAFTRASEIRPIDARSRKSLITEYFGLYGWNTIPKTKRSSIETAFIQNSTRFPLLCLSLYVHCIDRIQTQLEREAGPVEGIAKRMLDLSPDELFTASEFMKSVSPTGKPTHKELAVLVFRRKVPFPDVLTDYSPEASITIIAYDTFNIKKPKSKRSNDKFAATLPEPLPSLH